MKQNDPIMQFRKIVALESEWKNTKINEQQKKTKRKKKWNRSKWSVNLHVSVYLILRILCEHFTVVFHLKEVALNFLTFNFLCWFRGIWFSIMIVCLTHQTLGVNGTKEKIDLTKPPWMESIRLSCYREEKGEIKFQYQNVNFSLSIPDLKLEFLSSFLLILLYHMFSVWSLYIVHFQWQTSRLK